MRISVNQCFPKNELELIRRCVGKSLLLRGIMTEQDGLGRSHIGMLASVVDESGTRSCDFFSRTFLPKLPDIPRLVARRCARVPFVKSGDDYDAIASKLVAGNELFNYSRDPDRIKSCAILVDDVQWRQAPDEDLPELERAIHIHKGIVFTMVSGKRISCVARDCHIGFLEFRCFSSKTIKAMLAPRSITSQYMLRDSQLLTWRRELRRPETLLRRHHS